MYTGLIGVRKSAGAWNSICGFYNTEGEIVVPVEWADLRFFKEGLAAVKSMDGYWGFIDENNNIVVEPIYEEVNDFNEGYAWVGRKAGDNYYDPFGSFINISGQTAFSLVSSQPSEFQEGMAAVYNRDNRKWGFINRNGTTVIPYEYTYVQNFDNELAAVSKGEGMFDNKSNWGFIDKENNPTSEFIYDEPKETFKGGLKIVQIGYNDYPRWGAYGAIDLTGKEVISCEYDKIGNVSEGLISVVKNNNMGFVDTNGKVVIPFTFSGTLTSFQNGLAQIGSGFINTEGEFVIPPDYYRISGTSHEILPFEDGYAYASTDSWGREPVQLSIVPIE